MKAIEIRNKYLNFFKNHGHVVIPSAPLIPENDPSVLFTTAGMQPLVPYLLGEPHPAGTRLTDYQKCVRTNDIDEVGEFLRKEADLFGSGGYSICHCNQIYEECEKLLQESDTE